MQESAFLDELEDPDTDLAPKYFATTEELVHLILTIRVPESSQAWGCHRAQRVQPPIGPSSGSVVVRSDGLAALNRKITRRRRLLRQDALRTRFTEDQCKMVTAGEHVKPLV